MKKCKIISSVITVKYTCPEHKQIFTEKIENPLFNVDDIYEQLNSTYAGEPYASISFICPHCKKLHSFEIS